MSCSDSLEDWLVKNHTWLNSLAWGSIFRPVVPSRTSNTSWTTKSGTFSFNMSLASCAFSTSLQKLECLVKVDQLHGMYPQYCREVGNGWLGILSAKHEDRIQNSQKLLLINGHKTNHYLWNPTFQSNLEQRDHHSRMVFYPRIASHTRTGILFVYLQVVLLWGNSQLLML